MARKYLQEKLNIEGKEGQCVLFDTNGFLTVGPFPAKKYPVVYVTLNNKAGTDVMAKLLYSSPSITVPAYKLSTNSDKYAFMPTKFGYWDIDYIQDNGSVAHLNSPILINEVKLFEATVVGG